MHQIGDKKDQYWDLHLDWGLYMPIVSG